MKTIIFFFIVLVVGCSSRENIVSVRQAQNDSPVILRIRKDRTSIHSLLYPIAFEFKKNGNREIWKSHSTLTLLATQDLPTFLYYMIDPLKSWCWGAILFFPFKNSRFS